MKTTDSVNNKKMNNGMTTIQLLTKSFCQDCKNLVSISKKNRDEKGNPISYEDIAKSEEFKTAYRKAKADFNELVKEGEGGDRIAHLIYYQEAYKDFSFWMVEGLYKKHLDAKDGGILFDESKYYNYRTKNIEASVKAEKKASLKKVESKKVIKTDHRKKAVIAVIALIAAIAFIVAAYKKGVKPVIKAIVYVIALLATIFVFSKAKRKVLDRIHNKFYGK